MRGISIDREIISGMIEASGGEYGETIDRALTSYLDSFLADTALVSIQLDQQSLTEAFEAKGQERAVAAMNADHMLDALQYLRGRASYGREV